MAVFAFHASQSSIPSYSRSACCMPSGYYDSRHSLQGNAGQYSPMSSHLPGTFAYFCMCMTSISQNTSGTRAVPTWRQFAACLTAQRAQLLYIGIWLHLHPANWCTCTHARHQLWQAAGDEASDWDLKVLEAQQAVTIQARAMAGAYGSLLNVTTDDILWGMGQVNTQSVCVHVCCWQELSCCHASDTSHATV